jgi:hypothetical protein
MAHFLFSVSFMLSSRHRSYDIHLVPVEMFLLLEEIYIMGQAKEKTYTHIYFLHHNGLLLRF